MLKINKKTSEKPSYLSDQEGIINSPPEITDKTTTTNKKPGTDNAPVISTYNQVKFDIYNLYQEWSKSYGSYKALERVNRPDSKESKHYEQLMTSYALQFHSLVESGWPDTMKRMTEYDQAVFDKSVIEKHGTLWQRFTRLCYAAHDNGRVFSPDKYEYKPYRFNRADFALINYSISRFLQFSGITAIEGRFQGDENEFGYGA